MTTLASSELADVIKVLEKLGDAVSKESMDNLYDYYDALLDEEAKREEEAVELAKLFVDQSYVAWDDMYFDDRAEYITYAKTAFKYFRDKGWEPEPPINLNLTGHTVSFTTKYPDNSETRAVLFGEKK